MDLQRLAHLLRQSWLVLLVFVAAGVGLGAAQNQLSPPKYSSHTTLLFALSSKGSLSLLADGNTYMQAMMPSYVKVVETPLVLQPVINQLGLDTTPKALAHEVSVDYQIDSVIADISVSNADAARAAEIANAIAQQVSVATTVLTPPGSDDLGQVAVTQISQAQPASRPYSPRLLPHLLAGLFGGLILGVGVVLLRDVLFSAPVNSREAVARATPAPLLGTFPLDPKSRSRPLPADTQPMLPRSESFRYMQSNLAHVVRGPKLCLVVTSPRADEGRTTTAANLAITIALANASRRVLLIDADLRSADIDDLLGVYSSLGLTSVVTNRTPLEEAVVPWTLHRADDPQIHFLAAGPPVPEPSDLLASESMSRLIRQAREMYDVVILDSAPLLDVTDGAILAAQADGAVIVVDAQKTRYRHLTESLNRLRLAGAHVIGVVLNRMPEAKEGRRSGVAGHDITVRRRAPIFGGPGEDEAGQDIPEAPEGSGYGPGDPSTAHPRTPGRLVAPNGRPVRDPFTPPGRPAGAPAESVPPAPSVTPEETRPAAGVNLYRSSFPQMLPVRKPGDDSSPPTRPTDLTELIDPAEARAEVKTDARPQPARPQPARPQPASVKPAPSSPAPASSSPAPAPVSSSPAPAPSSPAPVSSAPKSPAPKSSSPASSDAAPKVPVKRPSPYQGTGERPGQSDDGSKAKDSSPAARPTGKPENNG
jgi:tyrosine-protein kinase